MAAMATVTASHVPRFSSRTCLTLWLGWLAVAAALCVPPLLWHFDYANAGHPRLYWLFVGALLAAALIVPPLYQSLRRKRLWRYEPLLLSAFAVAALLFYEPRATLVTAWIFLAAYGTGRFLRERLRAEVDSAAAEIAISAGAGFGLLILVFTAAGVAHGYRAWVVLLMLAAPTVAFHRQIARLPAELGALRRSWAGDRELAQPLLSLAVVFSAALLLAGLMVILAPSITFDALKFHLPLAEYYARTGALAPMPSETYSYNPQGFESLLTMAFLLGGQPAAQMVHPLFFVLMLLALYAVGRECGLGRAAAITGCVFTAALPFLHCTGVTVKNDLAVAFYHLAGLLAFLRWRRNRNFRWIQLGTFFAAISANFKYPAAFGILALAVLYAWAAWRTPGRVRAFVSCAVLFAALSLFWPVRTALLTGDPFFPNNIKNPIPSKHHKTGAELLWKRAQSVVLWPLEAHFGGRKVFQSVTKNPMGVALVVGLPLWLLLRRRERSAAARWCGGFAAVYLLPWSFQLPVLRFAIAPLALVMVFTLARWVSWHRLSGGVGRASLHLAAALSLMFSACVILILEVNAPQFRLFAGQTGRAGYLREALLTYRSLEALRAVAHRQDDVYSIRNCSRAYAPFPERFVCRYWDPEEWGLAGARRNISEKQYRYLILPRETGYDQFLPIVAHGRQARRLWTGPHFTIYEFAGPPPDSDPQRRQ